MVPTPGPSNVLLVPPLPFGTLPVELGNLLISSFSFCVRFFYASVQDAPARIACQSRAWTASSGEVSARDGVRIGSPPCPPVFPCVLPSTPGVSLRVSVSYLAPLLHEFVHLHHFIVDAVMRLLSLPILNICPSFCRQLCRSVSVCRSL